jgi:hypothetical protein
MGDLKGDSFTSAVADGGCSPYPKNVVAVQLAIRLAHLNQSITVCRLVTCYVTLELLEVYLGSIFRNEQFRYIHGYGGLFSSASLSQY